MKGLTLTAGCFVLLIFFSVPVLRKYRGKKYFFPLLYLSILSWVLYSILYFCLPLDLGFLPDAWLFNRTSVDYINGLVILALLSVAFSHTVFAAFIVGLSCGLLIEMLKKKDSGITQDDLLKEDDERGEGDSVFKSRLENLIRGKYIREETNGELQLLPKGMIFALLTLGVQKLLNMGRGG